MGERNKCGYVPEKDNRIFSRLMDAGKLLAAKISDIQLKASFTMISIGIYLADFSLLQYGIQCISIMPGWSYAV